MDWLACAVRDAAELSEFKGFMTGYPNRLSAELNGRKKASFSHLSTNGPCLIALSFGLKAFF
jgi:hypothetical protein